MLTVERRISKIKNVWIVGQKYGSLDLGSCACTAISKRHCVVSGITIHV